MRFSWWASLKNLLRRTKRAKLRPIRKRHSISLEALENRILLATDVLSTSLPAVIRNAGDALIFNGVNDYLITPNLQSAFGSGTSTTIELWFKANGPGVLVDELGQTQLGGQGGSFHDSQIEILSSGQVDARVYNLPTLDLGQASFGTWNFVALSYNSANGGVLDGVLNGIASSTIVTGAARPRTTTATACITLSVRRTAPTSAAAPYFNGTIGDITIWNVARTTVQIQADMSQVPTTPQSGLVAQYQLDDGSGLTAADASGNNFTANLGGGSAANAPAWVTSTAPTGGVVSTGTASTQTAIDNFSVVVSQPLSLSSATTTADYSLTDNDGHSYQIIPSYTSGTQVVSFTISPEPLQPGLTYTFQTLSGLTDANGGAVTTFTQQFTVENPIDGQIALTTHTTEAVPGATELPMTQVSEGFLTALAVGTFASTSDTNYWYLNASAGDQLTVRVEAQSPGNSIYPQLYLQNINGTTLTSVSGNAAGVVELDDYTITTPGTYFLKVYSNNSSASYQMRVDQSQAGSGPLLDTTPNNSQTNPVALGFTSSNQGEFSGSVAGALPLGSNGDYYSLGTLNGGNAIALTASAPSISSLYTGSGSPPALELALFLAGNSSPQAVSTTGSLNYSIPAGATGNYIIAVLPSIPTPAVVYQTIRAQYLLSVNVVDGVAPTVTATSLPPAAGTTAAIVNQFTLTFSENLAAATVTNPANYSLQSSNGTTYQLAPAAYTNGLTENIVVTNGPLQPGNYTLTVGSGITDRAQNPLTTFQLQFTVAAVAPYVDETPNDNTPASATPLTVDTDCHRPRVGLWPGQPGDFVIGGVLQLDGPGGRCSTTGVGDSR